MIIGLTLILLAFIFITIRLIFSKQEFARPDRTLANGQIELCSDSAHLCFTRPSDWTRSSILHAGTARQNDIEINPPTGTILRFEAMGKDTDEVCPATAKCTISVNDISHMIDGRAVVSGILESNFADPSDVPDFTPFVQLLDSSDLRSYGLQSGKSTAYTDFNPGVSFDGGLKVMLQISPGKEFNLDSARQWLTSREAATAKQILSSVHSSGWLIF